MKLFCTQTKSVGSFRVDFASISHGFRLHFAYVSQDSQKLKLPSLSNRPPKAAGRAAPIYGSSRCRVVFFSTMKYSIDRNQILEV